MNYRDKANDRIIWQYRNDNTFAAWIAILPGIVESDLSLPFEQIAGLINLNTARGAQLDICGRIVGVARPILRDDELNVFAYNGVAGAQPYGVAPYKGREEEPVSLPVPDYLYRVVIRAKIMANTSRATIDDIKVATEFILGPGYSARVVDNQDMSTSSILVILNAAPPFNVRAILDTLDLIPRPQGVGLSYTVEVPTYPLNGTLGGNTLGTVTLGGTSNA